MENDLSNKTYVVTGATSGIGLAVTEMLLKRGASVIGVGRSIDRCREAEHHLEQDYPAGRIKYLVANLAEQREVRSLAGRIHNLLESWGVTVLDGLVNNAGTFTYWFTQTSDGIETQWAVNHLAPFLLTRELLPLLKAAPFARVVTVSSDSHYGARLNWDDPQLRHHYTGLQAYGNTKLANILFTIELNRQLGSESNIKAFAADPGLVKTNIGFKGTPFLVRWVWKLRRSAGNPPEMAAQGIVFLLTEPSIQDSTEIYWKSGQPKKPSRNSLDPSSASRLWALSSRICGLDTGEQHE